ncbi:MAG: YbaN family protein [Ignavibacteria bacterium]
MKCNNFEHKRISGLKKGIFLIAGFFFTGIGILGIFTPILPTTVFLLIAAYFFSRSSERLYGWLLNSKISGSYIKAYREGKPIPLISRITSIIFLWVMLSLSIVVFVKSIVIRILLIAVGIGVTIHILTVGRKRIPKPEQNPTES